MYTGQPEPMRLGNRVAHGGVDRVVGGHRHDGVDQIHRLIAQDAGGLAVRIAVDDAGLRVGRCRRDAGHPQSQRIGASQVQVAAPEHDRVVGRGRVEILAGEQPRLGPVGLVPALALDPLAGRSGLRAFVQGLLHGGQRSQSGQPQLTPAQRPALEMKMRVDQARQDAPAAEIDHPAARPGERQDVIVAADGQNAPGLHGQGCGVGKARVLGPEFAVEEDKVRHDENPTRTLANAKSSFLVNTNLA